MKLTDEEQALRAGAFGPAAQWAIEHQIRVGDYLGAADFVPVTQAHIMADTESLGRAGGEWLEHWAALPAAQRQVRVPTITDPRGTDFAQAQKLKQQPWMLDLERRAIAAFEALGVLMTDTCINYQTIMPPVRGEHVAYGDTGVVIYCNSVCGARSNFEGGPSALSAGLTGRTPRYGFHLPEQRRATLRIRVDHTPTTLSDVAADNLPVHRVSRADVEALQKSYHTDDTVDVVVFSAPQLSLYELGDLAALCDGRTFSVPMLAVTSPQVKPDSDRMGYTARIEAAGGSVLSGMCFYQSYAREISEARGWKRLATNSAKLVNILGGYGYRPMLASMEACVEAAVSGKLVRT